MDWFIFILIVLAWTTGLFFFIEKKEIVRTGILALLSVFLGTAILLQGIKFPTGWTITTSGSTQTIVQTFTTYTTANEPWINLCWLLIALGLFLFVEIFLGLILGIGDSFKLARERFGF